MNGIFGIGIAELFFIAVIALVVLGPERLPATFRELAKYYRMARNLSGDLTSQFSEELKALDDINPQKIIQEVLDDPSLDDFKLDDINPKKISDDLAQDEAKNRKKTAPKKTTPKKTTPKKTAAKKPAAKKTATDSLSAVDSTESSGLESITAATDAEAEAVMADVADNDAPAPDGTDEKSSVVPSTAEQESIPAETTADADVETSDVDKSEDVVADGAPDRTNDASTAVESTAEVENAPAELTAEVDTADEDTLPDNRIAPDELTANLEQEAPSQDTIPSEPASLSVNGTHDSVEDRA